MANYAKIQADAPFVTIRKTPKTVAAAKPSAKKTIRKMGPVNNAVVPKGKYYGPLTALYLEQFTIGKEILPAAITRSLGLIKKAAAITNQEIGLLSRDKTIRIVKAAEEVIEHKLDEHFPLYVWQTGSGAHSNHNTNEVIMNRANAIAGNKPNDKDAITFDDVNMSQGPNDAFLSAVNIACYTEVYNGLLPAVKNLRNTLARKAKEFEKVVKIGRTHSMDAFPMTLGQEFDCYVRQMDENIKRVEHSITGLLELAIGDTEFVLFPISKTKMQEYNKFANGIVKNIGTLTKTKYTLSRNKLFSLASRGNIVYAHSAIKTLATSLFKMVNDIRMMASGPRTGLNELNIYEFDVDSTHFVGKVNPTHCEALAMCCLQVLGNDTVITTAAASGEMQLNTFQPLIAYNFLQSVKILEDACSSFEKYCLKTIKANRDTLKQNVERSLIFAITLSSHIGMENATKAAQLAYEENITIKEAAIQLGIISEDEYDRLVKPEQMIPSITLKK